MPEPRADLVPLTEEIIEQGRSTNGGWSRGQLEAIGVEWPPVKGWKKRWAGRPMSQRRIDLFLSLRNVHVKAGRMRNGTP
jgi:hypothetical protein